MLFRFQNETSTIIWFLWYSWNGRLFRRDGNSEILACHTKFSLWWTKSKSIFYYFWAHREAHNSCLKMSMKSRGTHSSFSPVLNRPSLLPFTLRFPPPCLLGSIRGRFSQRVTYQSPFPSCSRSSSYLLIVSGQWFLWIFLRNLSTKPVNIRSLIFVENDEAFRLVSLRGLNVSLALSFLLFKSFSIPPVTAISYCPDKWSFFFKHLVVTRRSTWFYLPVFFTTILQNAK